MNRKVLAVLVAFSSIMLSTVGMAALPDYCVRVFVTDRGGSHSMGSGTLLTPELVVTNYHVIKDAKPNLPVKILFPDWGVTAGKVIQVDKLWDIAVIRIPSVKVTPAVIGKKPKKGDTLTVHGYGMGLPASSTGKLDSFKAPTESAPQDFIEIKGARVRNGDSGGPITNEKGEYVGTLFGGKRGYTVGTHVGRVQKILGDLLKIHSEYNLTTEQP